MFNIGKGAAMLCSVILIVFLWFIWAGTMPMNIGVIIYFTFIGLFHIFSLAFGEDDIDALRYAMKMDKEYFVGFIGKRFLIKTITNAMEAVKDIKAYCKKGGVSEDDEKIKNALNAFEKLSVQPSGDESKEN